MESSPHDYHGGGSAVLFDAIQWRSLRVPFSLVTNCQSRLSLLTDAICPKQSDTRRYATSKFCSSISAVLSIVLGSSSPSLPRVQPNRHVSDEWSMEQELPFAMTMTSGDSVRIACGGSIVCFTTCVAHKIPLIELYAAFSPLCSVFG